MEEFGFGILVALIDDLVANVDADTLAPGLETY
jgi:hypothetical protein